MNLKNKITEILTDAIKKLNFVDEKEIVVSFSNRPELCDFQSNYALLVSKQLQMKPIEVAEKIVEKANEQSEFEFSAVMPGFINIIVKNKTLSDYLNEILEDKNLGLEQVKNPRLIFLDYGGANVAKELHVGHLRSPIVGEALKRVHEVLGDKTISDVHLGDFGLQMGLTILQLKLDGFLDNFFKTKNFSDLEIENVTLDVLNDEYPKASRRKDEDAEFKKLADEYTLYIQQHKEPYFTIYQKLKVLSVAEIRKNYDLLNSSFDYYYGESDAYPFIDQTIKIFVDKKLARESEGALVVDVAREGEHIAIPKKNEDEPQRYKNPMPPAIIKKYNGGDLYATTDIATILMRNKEFAPNEIIYITDNRQATHFEQVFRCCKLADISPQEQKLTHVGFGTMNGSDGKPFKTRAGGVVRLKEVIGLLIDKSAEKLSSNGIVGDKELARKIGVGAMKFGDLSNTVDKDYVFDMDKFLAFDGKTGPYIQYTIARINSIIKKSNAERTTINIDNQDEREIALAVLKLNSAYRVCYDSYSMNTLCLATFDLASAFSTFYNNHKILTEQNDKREKEMLSICILVKTFLEKALFTLGIDSVEKM